MNHTDPISHEMKMVAVAIFGETLNHKSAEASAAIRDVVRAIAGGMWPEDRKAQDRFVGFCLNTVTIDKEPQQ